MINIHKNNARYYTRNMLSNSAIETKLQELPKIELSYETFPTHRKVPENYTVCLAIPRSKKYIAWFTFIEDQDVCLLLELNREKRVVHAKQIHVEFDLDGPHMALGTFLYGSLSYVPVDEIRQPRKEREFGDRAFFIIEDILMYKAVSLRKLCFGIRLGILKHLLSDSNCLPMDTHSLSNVIFSLPMMSDARNSPPDLTTLPYKVHHLQYRSLTQILPYINVLDSSPCGNSCHSENSSRVRDDLRPNFVGSPPSSPTVPCSTVLRTFVPIDFGQRAESLQQLNPEQTKFAKDFGSSPAITPITFCSNPCATGMIALAGMTCPIDYIGKQRAIFMVTADLQSDIYYLVDPLSIYVTDVAYIPNYTVSVFMNSLFRNIKENRNLDAIEESDDEDDFYDMRVDKYVDLSKEIRMECVYHKKFRRWIPYKTM